MVERVRDKQVVKFSFGKQTEYFESFSKSVGAFCMYDEGYGLGIPDYLSLELKLRAVFMNVIRDGGIFLFNISGVDLNRARMGFSSFDEAFDNNLVTEWELSYILHNQDILDRTIFHNGVNELTLTKRGIKVKWN
jgi:hypothetical protein